jgi:hypothetical protein
MALPDQDRSHRELKKSRFVLYLHTFEENRHGAD